MRKTILILALAVSLFAAYALGIRHAICDSTMFIVEFSSDDPIPLYIELDGQTYVHELFVG